MRLSVLQEALRVSNLREMQSVGLEGSEYPRCIGADCPRRPNLTWYRLNGVGVPKPYRCAFHGGMPGLYEKQELERLGIQT